MIIIASLALFLSISKSDILLINTSQWAKETQQKCVQILPQNSSHLESLASLICGEKITDAELKENLQRTSLIHIFVVSGSHLLLLDQLLSILRIPLFVRFLFLSFYALAVGWQAPAVRALLALLTRSGLQHWQLHFPADLTTLIAGMISLILFPAWWSSLSFLLSWCAALALCWPSLLRIHSGLGQAVLMQISLFLFMTAPLWGLGSLHPLSLLYNLLLAPVVSFLLLPLALLSLLAPTTAFIFDMSMDIFSSSLKHLAEPVRAQKVTSLPLTALWFWIFAWHVFMHLLRTKLWRGRDSQ